MAAVVPPNVVPPGGAPAPAVTPQLPYGADPGTITGWILENTTTETSESISIGLELGFNRLVDNIPSAVDPGHDAAMRDMADEVMHSDSLVTYLVATMSATTKCTLQWYIQLHAIVLGLEEATHYTDGLLPCWVRPLERSSLS